MRLQPSLSRQIWTTILVATLAQLTVGCGADGGETSPTGSAASTTPSSGVSTEGQSSSPLITSAWGAEPDQSGEAAEIGGTLVLFDGCLMLDSVEGGQHSWAVAVWPTGTMWDEATDTLVFPNGDSATVGEGVQTGGGYRWTADELRDFGVGDEATAEAARCLDALPEPNVGIAIIQSSTLGTG